MAETKKKRERIALVHESKPLKGTLKYPRVNEPDTKFKAQGEFSLKLMVSGAVAEAVRPQMEAVAQKGLAEAKAKLEKQIAEGKGEAKGKAKKKLAELALGDLPMKPVFDDEGNETGDFEIHYKMNASYTDKATQKVKKLAPRFFDANGLKLDNPPQVWGGTVARVSGNLEAYFVEATNKAGCKVQLSALQILKLVSGGGGNAEQYGFGKEEDGEFDGSEAPAADTDNTPAASGGEEPEEF